MWKVWRTSPVAWTPADSSWIARWMFRGTAVTPPVGDQKIFTTGCRRQHKWMENSNNGRHQKVTSQMMWSNEGFYLMPVNKYHLLPPAWQSGLCDYWYFFISPSSNMYFYLSTRLDCSHGKRQRGVIFLIAATSTGCKRNHAINVNITQTNQLLIQGESYFVRKRH